MAHPVEYGTSLLSQNDLNLFNEGSHYRLHEKLGAHPISVEGTEGTYFAVWAPNARQVSVVGDFNDWNSSSHQLRQKGKSGIWEGFIAGIGTGTLYKYSIVSEYQGYHVEKADPLAFYAEVPPGTASQVWKAEYQWSDKEWMDNRKQRNALDAPISIYELHLGSWQRVPEEENRFLTYREIAPRLANYLTEVGFTHVEFVPIMEHQSYGSWGYQTTAYFSPTSRYGSPQDLMYLIDYLHQHNIGVILDWVPSHFPNDTNGLGFFDGTHLYERDDPMQETHPDWSSLTFNLGRNEVRSFLMSSAIFWLDKYHADGLRVNALASILYLDYGRNDGEWVGNRFGGHENLDAISFLRSLNEVVHQKTDGAQTIAEGATVWPMVSRPPYVGGLGFGLKWDTGWMHDTLEYMAYDPVFRKHHHNNLTSRMTYAFSENFVLPLPHDQVAHGKGSLLNRMPGDKWRQFANLRLLFGYMYGEPGKKLLFMGDEFGQEREWDHDSSLDWHILQYLGHSGVKKWIEDLNRFYRDHPALYEMDTEQAGFQWIDSNDIENSVISFLRNGKSGSDSILVICNFTPVPRHNYRVGAPKPGFWQESLNSDAGIYGGSGQGNLGGVEAAPIPLHGQPYSLTITVPPLAVVFFKRA